MHSHRCRGSRGQGYRYGQVEPLVLLNLITSGPGGDRYFRVSFLGNRPRDSAARHILYAFRPADPIYHPVRSFVPRSLRSFVRSPPSFYQPSKRRGSRSTGVHDFILASRFSFFRYFFPLPFRPLALPPGDTREDPSAGAEISARRKDCRER